MGVDGVFSSQGDTAEKDEEEDDVGEGSVVDDPVANLPEPFNREHQLLTTDSKPLTPHFGVIWHTSSIVLNLITSVVYMVLKNRA